MIAQELEVSLHMAFVEARLDKGHVQADFEFLGNHVQFLMSLRPGVTVYGNGATLFNGFKKTLQGVAGFVGGVPHLVHLGGGNVLGIHPANTLTVQVDLEHDLGGGFANPPPRSCSRSTWTVRVFAGCIPRTLPPPRWTRCGTPPTNPATPCNVFLNPLNNVAPFPYTVTPGRKLIRN